MVTALFVDEPFTQRSLDTVSQIRSLVGTLRALDPSLGQDSILVGGASASTLDFANDTVNQFNTMRILTVAAIFVVLLVVLGSYPLRYRHSLDRTEHKPGPMLRPFSSSTTYCNQACYSSSAHSLSTPLWDGMDYTSSS